MESAKKILKDREKKEKKHFDRGRKVSKKLDVDSLPDVVDVVAGLTGTQDLIGSEVIFERFVDGKLTLHVGIVLKESSGKCLTLMDETEGTHYLASLDRPPAVLKLSRVGSTAMTQEKTSEPG